jgi:predicted nucleic acid-binding Zn ribbon protein
MIRPMQSVASGLQKVMAKSLRLASASEAPVLAWPLACGGAVAKRTQALEFNDGVLKVQVPDAGWRSELQAIAAQYLAILNPYVGHGVTRIEFVVANDKFAKRASS